MDLFREKQQLLIITSGGLPVKNQLLNGNRHGIIGRGAKKSGAFGKQCCQCFKRRSQKSDIEFNSDPILAFFR